MRARPICGVGLLIAVIVTFQLFLQRAILSNPPRHSYSRPHPPHKPPRLRSSVRPAPKAKQKAEANREERREEAQEDVEPPPRPRAAPKAAAVPHATRHLSVPPSTSDRATTGGGSGGGGRDPQGHRYAFVNLISNEKYVDGALTFGWSFRKQSKLLQEGKCDLVVMLPQNSICEANLERFRQVGFTIVPITKDLAQTNVHSAWKDTLNKLYLFNLTDYHKIVFFDADVMALANPDELFQTELPDSRWVAAIGSQPKYFATGVMVIMPDRQVADDIVNYYLNAARNSSDKRGFKGYNARDGLVFRWFIGKRHKALSHKWSEHTSGNSVAHIKVFHFRGGWKPWYNKRWNGKEVSHLVKDLRGTFETRSTGYKKWWKHYEEMHRTFWNDSTKIGKTIKGKYGGDSLSNDKKYMGGKNIPDDPSIVTPENFVWVNRYTKWEYVQPLIQKEKQFGFTHDGHV